MLNRCLSTTSPSQSDGFSPTFTIELPFKNFEPDLHTDDIFPVEEAVIRIDRTMIKEIKDKPLLLEHSV